MTWLRIDIELIKWSILSYKNLVNYTTSRAFTYFHVSFPFYFKLGWLNSALNGSEPSKVLKIRMWKIGTNITWCDKIDKCIIAILLCVCVCVCVLSYVTYPRRIQQRHHQPPRRWSSHPRSSKSDGTCKL